MRENPKRLPADQDPDENDDKVTKTPLSNHGWHIAKRLQMPTKSSSPDLMGKMRERDKSSQTAEQWLQQNDPERKNKPDAQMN